MLAGAALALVFTPDFPRIVELRGLPGLLGALNRLLLVCFWTRDRDTLDRLTGVFIVRDRDTMDRRLRRLELGGSFLRLL